MSSQTQNIQRETENAAGKATDTMKQKGGEAKDKAGGMAQDIKEGVTGQGGESMSEKASKVASDAKHWLQG